MANTKHSKFRRLSVPVPDEAIEAFDELCLAMGRSRSSVIADFLLDSAPVARSMARAVSEIRFTRKNFVADVLALSENVTSATAVTLERHGVSVLRTGGAPLAGGHRALCRAPLPPRLVIRGGKYLGSRKNLVVKHENHNRLAHISDEVQPIQNH